jgi:hypothetical protein
MVVSIEELLEGRATRIKDRDYFETRAYVEPFLERVSQYTEDFKVKVELPEQVTYTQEGNINTEDITYNRVWVQGLLPNMYDIDGIQQVIGMVYGLDVKKPVFKVYTGGLDNACTNLCVFSPNMLNCQEIQPETAVDFRPVTNIMKQTDDISMWLHKLIDMEFSCENSLVNESLGRWIRNCMDYSYDSGFGKIKLATSIPIGAYKLLFTKDDSRYNVTKKNNPSMFDVYGAFTQIITDNLSKDIMNQTEKTLLLKSILDI